VAEYSFRTKISVNSLNRITDEPISNPGQSHRSEWEYGKESNKVRVGYFTASTYVVVCVCGRGVGRSSTSEPAIQLGSWARPVSQSVGAAQSISLLLLERVSA
jgi:hypothetical protein